MHCRSEYFHFQLPVWEIQSHAHVYCQGKYIVDTTLLYALKEEIVD